MKWETHLRELDLAHEAHAEVLEDDAVGRREEGEDVGDEVLLVIGEVLPVLHVVAKVDLLGCDFTGKRELATTVNSAPRTRRKTGRARRRDRARSGETRRTGSLGREGDVPVQKEASAFLYISQMSPYLMGNMVKRSSLGSSRGSATRVSVFSSAPMVAAVCFVGVRREC